MAATVLRERVERLEGPAIPEHREAAARLDGRVRRVSQVLAVDLE